MRFRTVGFLVVVALLQLWLVSYSTNAQGESDLDIESDDRSGLRTQDSAEQPAIQCQVTVLIQGGGAVHARLGDNSSILLSDFNNQIPVSCGDITILTAVPADQWRFEGWAGMSDQLITSLSIQVRGGQEVTAVFTPEGLYYETVDVPYIDRNGRLTNQVPFLQSTQRSLAGQGIDAAATAEPVINVWFGDFQPFGQIGMSQKYVNILGTVSDADGDLDTLKYSLNGEAEIALNIGADTRRLQNPGDFNIDIDEANLVDGENELLITATDSLSNQEEYSVTIDYDEDNVWPLPPGGYFVDWDKTGNIQDVAQVVDGQWSVSPDGVQTASIGYDRLVAIGDQNWIDYEATIPVTVMSIDPRGFYLINRAPAVGVIMHWTGHTDNPIDCKQPKCGYLETIASWHEWDEESGAGKFCMWLRLKDIICPESTLMLETGETYFWKIRSEGSKAPNGEYKMKVWHEKNDTEPTEWLVTLPGKNYSPDKGSILLVAHYVDVIFGNILITPLNPGPDTTAPQISDVFVAKEPKGATIHWITDEPATSKVNFGQTSSYDRTVEDPSLSTEHFIYLDDLQTEKPYHFEIESADSQNNTAVTPDDDFITQELIAVESDDFNYCALDPAWQFIDPLNDSDYSLTTTQLDLIVPAGAAHDIWPEQGKPLIRTPRIMRNITDPNNLQVKFDSGVSEEVGFQGVLFEQDENNVFRVSYQFKNAQTELYIIGHRGAQNAKIFKKVNVNGADADGPLYIWTTRENGRWHVRYSINGTTWSDAGTFDFPLTITKAGVFAGNVAGPETPETIPAVYAQLDYWFNADSTLDPEDDTALILPVNVQGNGSVAKNVACGNPVTLTATPAAGWQFVKWTGSPIDGQTNPQITTSFQYGDQVTAVFEEIGEGPFTLVTSVSGQGVIIKDPDKSAYGKGESVSLTAQPGAGWTFDHWEGALSGNNVTQILTMDANKYVTAVFVEQEGFDLQVDVVGSGKVLASPEKLLYQPGESVLLIAFSDPGWRFDQWEGDVTGVTNRISITMSKHTTVTAIFEQVEFYTVHLPFINR